MSHFKERTEKNCLNCNAEVNGRFCQVCGQENVEPHETFWHLVAHFFNDITHFDGKFFSTTKFLLIKPGFLPKEYLQGRRSSFLHPIRMYVFASAIFFLAFFGLNPKLGLGNNQINDFYKNRTAKLEKIDRLDSLMLDTRDSNVKAAFADQKVAYEREVRVMDSIQTEKYRKQWPTAFKKDDENVIIQLDAKDDSLNTIEKYEAQQNSLPEEKRDGWFEHMVAKKQVQLKGQYRFRMDEYNNLVKEKFFHSLPQMFFVSLPLFAFVLFLLNIRRKQYYYTDHAIFSVYHFTAVFVMSLLMILIQKLALLIHWPWMYYINFGILLYAVFYLYKSMRYFYGQPRGKTIAKFILLFAVSGILTALLALLFLLITFFKT